MLKTYIYTLFVLLNGLSVTSQTINKKTFSNFDYEKPKTYEIGGVTITGVKFLDTEILTYMTGFKEGNIISVPGDDITKAINKLWEQGLFADIKIIASKIEGKKIFLEIQLKERQRLSEVAFFTFNKAVVVPKEKRKKEKNTYGKLKKSEAEDLKEATRLIIGNQVTDNVINNTKNIIKKFYREKGYYSTDVKIRQIEDTLMANTAKLYIYVNKNKKVKVHKIHVEGNNTFSEKKIEKTMKKTNEKGIRNFFRTKKFVQEKYNNDLKKIIEKYNEKGYRDAKFEKDTIALNQDNTMDVFLKIDEGNKYFFGDITWTGNTIYMTKQLTKRLRIQKGDIFIEKNLDDRLTIDEDAVSNLYLDNGYLFFNVTPIETSIENDTVNIEMRVFEGRQATLNNVIITGNTKTHEHVARRELRTEPGDLFSKSDLIRSIRELAQLGFFDPEKITPDVRPNPEEATVDIEYQLEEKANDQVEVSGGWGGGIIIASVGLRFNNFSLRNFFKKEAWQPLPSGDGQKLALKVQTNGSYYQSYSLSFVEPWLGGKKPNSLSFSIYRSIETGGSSYQNRYDINNLELQQNRKYTVTGISLGLGRRLIWPDDWFTLYNSIDYQIYDLQNWYSSAFTFNTGNFNNLSFTNTLSRNSIDNPLYTRRGSTFTLTLQLTPPYSLFKKDKYWELTEDEINKIENDPIYKNNVEIAQEKINEVERNKYKWIEYHKWSFSGKIYNTIWKDLVFHTGFSSGFLGHYSPELRSPFEVFEMGGDGISGYRRYGVETIGLRGYANNSLTPIEIGRGSGGTVYIKNTLEIRYPLSLNPSATVYFLTFYEMGNTWNEFKLFNPFELKRSVGAGIRIFLPMLGLMGIDYGYGFDEIQGNPGKNGNQYHFIIGQQF